MIFINHLNILCNRILYSNGVSQVRPLSRRNTIEELRLYKKNLSSRRTNKILPAKERSLFGLLM